MDPVVHFEMPYKDAKRLSKFYKTVFNWGMNDAGPGMGNYILAITTPIDKKTTRPKNPGAINGGFFKYDPKKKELQKPAFVIAVDNLEEAMAMVKKAGGKIFGKPQEIPGIGKFVAFGDTEGNRVEMLQPVSM